MTFNAALLLAQLGQNASGSQTDPVLRQIIMALDNVALSRDTDFWPNPFVAPPCETEPACEPDIAFISDTLKFL